MTERHCHTCWTLHDDGLTCAEAKMARRITFADTSHPDELAARDRYDATRAAQQDATAAAERAEREQAVRAHLDTVLAAMRRTERR